MTVTQSFFYHVRESVETMPLPLPPPSSAVPNGMNHDIFEVGVILPQLIHSYTMCIINWALVSNIPNTELKRQMNKKQNELTFRSQKPHKTSC